MANLAQIYDWFMTGKKPTQAQFWASWGSFWNKEETIPQSAISNLGSTLSAKTENDQFNAHKVAADAHTDLFTGKEDKSQKGAAGGYVPLNEFIKITSEYLSVVNDLVTGGATDLLSAEQGKILQTQITAINTLLTSNDVNLDTVQELVDAIKTVETSLETILVNDLTTGGTTKALTAEMGKILELSKVPNFIKSNGDISLLRRNGDILYGMLDQYTGEEIILFKVLTIPAVDNIIYFNLSGEFFKRNYKDVNVKWFGAKGDGINDDTPSIQSAINFVYNSNGGTIYFPNGIYKLSSALTEYGTGLGNLNSQLFIPNTRDNFLTVRFRGETPPAQVAGVLGDYPVNSSGVVIYSTIQGTGTYPSIVSSVGTVSSGYTNGILFSVENIEFRVKANTEALGPNMSALNLQNILNVDVKSVFCSLDISTNLSVYPTNETFGIYFPRVNLGQSSVNDCAVTGYKYGYVISEHVMGDLITAVGCEHAFVFANSYHPNSFNRMNSAWCKYAISAGIGTIYNTGLSQSSVNIAQLDVEWQANTYGNWFDASYVVNDASNFLKGKFEYQMVERSIGINNEGFSKNGGAEIHAIALGVNHLPMNGGVLKKFSSGVSCLLNVYNPNGNNGAGASILLGTSLVEGNGNARITGTAFAGNDYRSKFQAQTTNAAGVWNIGICIDEFGQVGIGTTLPTSNIQVIGLLEFTDNSTAMIAGLTPGAFYRTGDVLKIVH